MASSRCVWIVVVLLSAVTRDTGVAGRAVNARGLGSRAVGEPAAGAPLRADAWRRWRRAVEEKHRGRCAELAAPWQENTRRAPEDNGTVLQLRVRPLSPGASRAPVFPGKALFNFVRRVYHCCQEGLNYRSVKGIQGRLRGDTDLEFLLSREILSRTVSRAELHLQLSNPQQLDVRPVLPSMAKRSLPTRYSWWPRGPAVELRVDLLLLFQGLQEAAGGARRGPSLVNLRRRVFSSGGSTPGEEPAPDGDAWGVGAGGGTGAGASGALPQLELGLILDCSRAGAQVSCGSGGVHLSHTPFMALYYR